MKYITPNVEISVVCLADILTESLLSQQESGLGNSKSFMDLISL